ncbi:hypothetical protein ANN_24058 [Periplaneta americana]|uniref:Uncharacterized protein n=1 Tax=Periplaneta americana TaxID=6978 RepID=A0ABQ8S2C1_PERAM|nr:hypothetical protein ANN_24058 [Periplaneta americana]
MIAIPPNNNNSYIIDPTVRFEKQKSQPEDVNREKNDIYVRTVPYFMDKYGLQQIEVIGLMVGARGTVPGFFFQTWQRFGLQRKAIDDIVLAALRGSIFILRNHLYVCHSYISYRKEITELGSSNLIGEISSVKVDFSLRQINLRLDFMQHKIPSSAEARINLTSDLRLNGLYNRALVFRYRYSHQNKPKPGLQNPFRSHICLNVHPLVPLNTKHLVPWNMFQITRYYRFCFPFILRSCHESKQASRSSTRVCVRICVSIRRPEFECSGPQLEGPEFECSGPQLEGPEFEYSELSLKVVVITEDVQNVHLLLEYRPHIDVSLTCEHDPNVQENCVCPQNMPQFDSEGIPNQAPETNKTMILNGPTSRNREGSDQVSVEAKQLGHLYLSIASIRKPSIQVPASRTTEVCRSAIMQEVNVLTIDQWSVF